MIGRSLLLGEILSATICSPVAADIYEYTQDAEAACEYFLDEFAKDQSQPALRSIEFSEALYFAGQELDAGRYLTIRWDWVMMAEGHFVDQTPLDGLNIGIFEPDRRVATSLACKTDVIDRRVLQIVFEETATNDLPAPTFLSLLAVADSEKPKLEVGEMTHQGRY